MKISQLHAETMENRDIRCKTVNGLLVPSIKEITRPKTAPIFAYIVASKVTLLLSVDIKRTKMVFR